MNRISGGCWISGAEWGFLNRAPRPFHISNEPPRLPDSSEPGLEKAPARWGRFDAFARLGFSAVALALVDADRKAAAGEPTGLVIASATETLANDVAFFATTIEQNGLLASPRLFSYTLPTTLIGECAIHFSLRGPTCAVGNRNDARGMDGLRVGLAALAAGDASRMICAWVEAAADPFIHQAPGVLGAACIVIDACDTRGDRSISFNGDRIVFGGRPPHHLEELFDGCDGR